MRPGTLLSFGVLLGWAAYSPVAPYLGMAAGTGALAAETDTASSPAAPPATTEVEPTPAPSAGASSSGQPAAGPTGRSGGETEVKQISPAEWQEEYRQLNELILRYDENVGSFRKDVQTIIEQKYRDELERIQGTYDKLYKKLEDEVRVRREQAISAFERFIQKYPLSDKTPLAMFRLAELYYEQSSYDFLVAQQNYDQILKGLDLSDTKSLPEDPKYDFSKSLALYDRIIKDFPAFKNVDAVYYMRGYLLGNDLAVQHDAEAAKDAWLELIRRRPDSVYASQAYLRIGDYYFEKGSDSGSNQDLHTSIEYYQRVMSYQDKLYDRALYKLAWAYYKLSDYDNAIARFVDLLDFSQAKLAETGTESDLRAEAIEYLAISFADHYSEPGDVAKVLTFFERIGDRPYKLEVLVKLADIYFKQAKFDLSIETYATLQTTFPDNEENPTFQARIVTIYQTMPLPNPDAALKSKEELIQRYSPDAEWWKRQGQNRAAVGKAQELAQTALQDLAFFYHEQAQAATTDGDRQKYFDIAAEKYREYLTRFPYSSNAYQLQFYFAECLYWSQHYDEAAVQYEKALTYTDPKYHVEAAQGRADSYRELMLRKEGEEGWLKPFPVAAKAEEGEGQPEASGQQEKAGEEPPTVIALTSLKSRFMQAVDIFARIAPEHQETPKYLFIVAQMNAYHHQFAEAEKRFEEFIELYPKHELAINSVTLLVDSLTAQQKWREVMDAIDKYSKLELGSNAKEWQKVKGKLLDIRSIAHLKDAEDEERRGENEVAREKFIKEGSDVALLRAAKISERLGKVDQAIEDYQRLARQHPKSQHVEYALFRIAFNYERFFDLPRAIDYYERLANSFPKSERAADSIANAAFLRIGLHQYKEAARTYERYSLAYQNKGDAEVMLFLAGQNYMKAEDHAEAVRAFRDYLRRYPRANGDRVMEAYANIITSLDKMNRGREALDQEKKVPALASLRELPDFSARGIYLYAQVGFRDIQRTLSAMQEIRFSGSEKALKAQLDRKTQLLIELENKVREFIKLGDVEWASAALYSMGLAYHSFADSMMESIPAGLSEEDKLIYQEALEQEYIFPFEERALLYYKRNLDIEETQKVWNKWIEHTYVQLNRLRPDLYPARKKELYHFVPGEQEFLAPPVQTVTGNTSARNEGAGIQ